MVVFMLIDLILFYATQAVVKKGMMFFERTHIQKKNSDFFLTRMHSHEEGMAVLSLTNPPYSTEPHDKEKLEHLNVKIC